MSIRWFDRRLTMGNLIVLGGILFASVGWYYTTTLTVSHQSKQIEILFEKNKEFFDQMARLQLSEAAARENIRQELQARSERATENQIKTLERLVAVETEIRGLRLELGRLLDRISPPQR